MQAPARKPVYPYGVPSHIILLWRPGRADRFWCQFPGCGDTKGFKSRTGARMHGLSHVPPGARMEVASLTGTRPCTKAELAVYRRQYKANHMAERRLREAMSRAAQVRGSDDRVFPTALSVMDDGSATGRSFIVQGVMGPKMAGSDLEVTGWASDEDMVEAIRCSYTWARLHQRAILQCFSRVPRATDLRSPDSTCYVELSKAALRKTGLSVGLAAACCFVRMITGVGLEPFVGVTGAVGMDGRIYRVGEIEAKLRFAAEAPDMSVVVLPEENREEAEAVLQQHDEWPPLQILPVRHMGEVIHWLFRHPVAPALALPSLDPVPRLRPDLGAVAVCRAMALLEEEVDFPVIECAVLPGTGKRHIMGTSFPDRSPQLHDQTVKAMLLSQQICGSSRTIHTRAGRRQLVHKLHEPESFDIYVMVRQPRFPGVGLAILCSLLAVAFGQTIDPRIIIAGDLGLRGKVFTIAPMTMADLRSVRAAGGSKLLVSPNTARQIADAARQAREDGEEMVQGLEVISIENAVLLQHQAEALWVA